MLIFLLDTEINDSNISEGIDRIFLPSQNLDDTKSVEDFKPEEIFLNNSSADHLNENNLDLEAKQSSNETQIKHKSFERKNSKKVAKFLKKYFNQMSTTGSFAELTTSQIPVLDARELQRAVVGKLKFPTNKTFFFLI